MNIREINKNNNINVNKVLAHAWKRTVKCAYALILIYLIYRGILDINTDLVLDKVAAAYFAIVSLILIVFL